MVGMNLVRYAKGARPSSFTLVVGVLALVFGAGAMAGIGLPVFPALLTVLGLHIVYSVATRR